MRSIFLLGIFVVLFNQISAQKFSSHYKVHLNGEPYAKAALAPNGNTLIYGNVDYLAGIYVGRLLCFDKSGVSVPSFNKVFTDGYINEVHVQANNKILISGEFTQINGVSVGQPVLLNEDGSVDAAFTSTISGPVWHIAVQSTGKIIINHAGTLKRLNANGSLDGTFTNHSSMPEFSAIAIGNQDEIFFTALDGNASKVFKLSSNGIKDFGFSNGTGANNGNGIGALAVQPDGKVLVGCDFESYNGVQSRGIIRLLPDGTVDETFNAGNKILGTIYRIALRDNKILIGGQLHTYGDLPASLVELNPDGSLSKILAVVMSNNISSIMLGTDNRVSIFGGFSVVNGRNKKFIARFNTDWTLDETLKEISISSNNRNITRLDVDNEKRAVVSSSYYTLNGAFLGQTPVGSATVRINALGSLTRHSNPKSTTH